MRNLCLGLSWGRALPSEYPPSMELTNLLDDLDKPSSTMEVDIPAAPECSMPSCIPTIVTRTDRDESYSPAESSRGTGGKVYNSDRAGWLMLFKCEHAGVQSGTDSCVYPGPFFSYYYFI